MPRVAEDLGLGKTLTHGAIASTRKSVFETPRETDNGVCWPRGITPTIRFKPVDIKRERLHRGGIPSRQDQSSRLPETPRSPPHPMTPADNSYAGPRQATRGRTAQPPPWRKTPPTPGGAPLPGHIQAPVSAPGDPLWMGCLGKRSRLWSRKYFAAHRQWPSLKEIAAGQSHNIGTQARPMENPRYQRPGPRQLWNPLHHHTPDLKMRPHDSDTYNDSYAVQKRFRGISQLLPGGEEPAVLGGPDLPIGGPCTPF